MNFERSKDLSEIIVLEPDIYGDQRGHFLEIYRSELDLEYGHVKDLPQDDIDKFPLWSAELVMETTQDPP